MSTAPISRRAAMTGLWATIAVTRAAFATDSLYDAAVAGDLVAVQALPRHDDAEGDLHELVPVNDNGDTTEILEVMARNQPEMSSSHDVGHDQRATGRNYDAYSLARFIVESD